MPNAQASNTDEGPMEQPASDRRIGLIDYIKRKMNEPNAKKKEETNTERAARITANATRWIAIFTVVLAAAAIYQFVIVSDQLRVMRISERAWVMPVVLNTQIAPDKPIFISFSFPNSGKTAAKHFTAKMRIEILNSADGPTFDYSNPLLNSWLEGNLEPPNSPFTPMMSVDARRQIPGTQTTEQIIFTKQLSEKYDALQLWFSVEGIVTYDDVFGFSHWTHLCGANYNRKDPFGPYPEGAKKCAQYNDIDNN